MSLYNDLNSVLTPYANKIKQNEANVRLALSLEGGGAPIVVASTSAMTDIEQIYVLSTDGNWYYHNGSAWVSGGTYGAVATDTTLTQSGIPADAKAVGDEISAIKADLDNLDDNVNDLKSAITLQKESIIQQQNDELRKPDKILNGVFAPYAMPDNVFNQIGVKLLTDGRTCFCDFDITAHKNTGGTTHYFSPTGSNSNQGTVESPWKDLTSQLMTNRINDGDTLILEDGIYPRFFQGSDPYSKSINIIAQNAGKVIIDSASSNAYEYTKTDDYNNTYQTSRSAVKSVLYKLTGDNYIPLREKTSISDVDNNPFTFACISGVTYINIDGVVPTNDKVFLNVQYGSLVKFQPNSADCKVYMEGLTFIGGTNGGVVVSNTSSYAPYLYANKCNFYGAWGDTYDAVSLLGAYGYFVDCECAYAQKDGFNYHAQNSVESVGFELRCRGYCNGIGSASENCNGSTQHGGPVIRIDGVYHDNYGPNVADVAATSKTMNINCVAFDSSAVTDGYGVDFIVQTAGAEMWCIGCRADFGNTPYNFYATSGTTMHMLNCDYKTTHGGGTFDIN